MIEKKIDLTVTSAPHIKDRNSVTGIMGNVLIALTPAFIWGLINFGLVKPLLIVVISVIASIAAEYIGNFLFHKKSSIKDLSAGVTGLLLALVLPPSSPYWMVVIGAFSAIILGKMIFGGIGSNPFNPALVGRAVLVVSWPTLMTTWTNPVYKGFSSMTYATTTSATPLAIAKLQSYSNLIEMYGSKFSLYKALFIGNVPGCIGETSALLLLIGGIYLIIRKVIDWKIPVSYIGTVFILSFIFGKDPIFSILAGGLFLGAFFMATDYSSSPITPKGKILYGVFIGIITVIIRTFSSYPEGVMFSILLGNAFVPYFDRLVPRVYGVFLKREVKA